MTRSHAGRVVRLNNMQITKDRWRQLRTQQDVSQMPFSLFLNVENSWKLNQKLHQNRKSQTFSRVDH